MSRAISKRAYDASSRRKSARRHANRLLTPPGGCSSTRATRPRPCRQSRRPRESPWSTVYATVGKKATLFRLLIEMAISGSDRAVPAEERDYVRAIREEADAARKLHLYRRRGQPHSVAPRPALLGASGRGATRSGTGRVVAGHRAAPREDKCGCWPGIWRQPDASGLHVLVARAADIIWSMNSSEFYLRLPEQRGWSAAAFERWLGDAWVRLLLKT